MPQFRSSLPARPNLENLRKQAKTLLKAFRAAKPEAVQQIQQHLQRFKNTSDAERRAIPLTLSDTQWVIARQYGFTRWPQLKAHVEALNGRIYVSAEVRGVERLHRDLFDEQFRSLPIREQLDRQAHRILAGHRAGDRAVLPHICSWLPGYARKLDDEIMQVQLTLEQARTTIAREYGYQSWQTVEETGTEPPNAPFEAAVDAVLTGDLKSLRQMLRTSPDLVHARSSYAHRSTLLHYIAANGVETQRQVVPINVTQIVTLLLKAGADVNAEADMYGGGSTPLHLLLTSDHPAKAGLTATLAAILRAAGATESRPSTR